jgi:hypothetical protein
MVGETLTIHYEAYGLPRRGNTPEEYEDAFAGDADRGRFAVADGASESSYAARWAQLLVEEFIKVPNCAVGPWSAWLPTAQKRWTEEIAGQPLSWYAECKLEQGAFAAFVGLVVSQTSWQAVAVGDCCLFHVRNNRLHRSFPMTAAGGFDNSPWLVGSRDDAAKSVPGKSAQAQGDYVPGDQFWLATDALAHWFLTEAESGAAPWRALTALSAIPDRPAAFNAWINAQWDQQRIRNDDITALRVQG